MGGILRGALPENNLSMPLTYFEPRLQARYDRMVASHLQASQLLASGIHAVPDSRSAFATTLAACRFLNNPRVTLRALAEPLLDRGREQAASACDRYLLIAHDWSQLMYADHASKKDRVALSSNRVPEGYELQAALLVSDRDGLPIAPGVLSLRAADGVHCSRSWRVRKPLSPLDELDPAMSFLEQQEFGRPLVHIVDAEADSVGHFRQWCARPGRLFLVRADDRIVEYVGQEQRCSAIRDSLRAEQKFSRSRQVLYHGKQAEQWIAEVAVRLIRPAQRNRPRQGDRKRIPGPPLSLRLVISEVRDADGNVLATWYLLSNVPGEVAAATLALWYYWRWSIEDYFKLLKSAGMQVEVWQQTTAAAIARRLLIAGMACVTVWRLARSTHPLASSARQCLVRLSGRQMKRGCEFTLPALLAGMWVLLAMIETLESRTPEEIRALADVAFGRARQPPQRR